MKKIKNWIPMLVVAGAFIGFSLNVSASGDVSVVRTSDDDKSKLLVEIPQKYDVMVSISDASKNLVFSEFISKNSSAGKIYNLSNLEDGEYMITTEAAHQTVTKKFKIESSQIIAREKSLHFDPYFSKTDDKLVVNYLNEGGEKVNLTLENETRIYLEDRGTNALVFGKMIDTQNLPIGYYTLTLEAGKDSYKYYFEKF